MTLIIKGRIRMNHFKAIIMPKFMENKRCPYCNCSAFVVERKGQEFQIWFCGIFIGYSAYRYYWYTVPGNLMSELLFMMLCTLLIYDFTLKYLGYEI